MPCCIERRDGWREERGAPKKAGVFLEDGRAVVGTFALLADIAYFSSFKSGREGKQTRGGGGGRQAGVVFLIHPETGLDWADWTGWLVWLTDLGRVYKILRSIKSFWDFQPICFFFFLPPL